MKFVFVRHGESIANRLSKEPDGFLCGRYDCELTEKGMEQAKSLRDNPDLLGADAYFCSPLKRTVQTITAFTDREYVLDDRIAERTMGDFDGHTLKELTSEPNYYEYFYGDKKEFRSSFTVTAPNGENYSDVEKRVAALLCDLKAKNFNKVVVVSHFVSIRCMIKVIKGLSEEETLRLKVNQCEPIVITI